MRQLNLSVQDINDQQIPTVRMDSWLFSSSQSLSTSAGASDFLLLLLLVVGRLGEGFLLRLAVFGGTLSAMPPEAGELNLAKWKTRINQEICATCIKYKCK